MFLRNPIFAIAIGLSQLSAEACGGCRYTVLRSLKYEESQHLESCWETEPRLISGILSHPGSGWGLRKCRSPILTVLNWTSGNFFSLHFRRWILLEFFCWNYLNNKQIRTFLQDIDTTALRWKNGVCSTSLRCDMSTNPKIFFSRSCCFFTKK
jgi:hypothetical protein